MTHRVIQTRLRLIEETVVTDVSAITPNDALAVANHLVDGEVAKWRFKKTISTSNISTQTVQLKEK